MSVEGNVAKYLSETTDLYQQGRPEYYARLALEQATIAYKEGNYGIGAIAVLTSAETISEFPNRNAMINGVLSSYADKFLSK